VACRVRVRIRHGNSIVETSALVNSGFESDAPDIVVPVEVAKRLGLWPPRKARAVVLETGGGETAAIYSESAVELELVLGDRELKRVTANVIIDPYIREVALSDYVSSLLGIMLIDIKRGLWRLTDDPPTTVRMSAPLEEW